MEGLEDALAAETALAQAAEPAAALATGPQPAAASSSQAPAAEAALAGEAQAQEAFLAGQNVRCVSTSASKAAFVMEGEIQACKGGMATV
eukprot:1990636-Lingulodinium_polyedra.AAC.1